MTKRWADVKKELRSISDSEKRQIEDIARLTSLLSQRRRMLDMTQREVAERAGLTQANIARIENAQMVPRLDTLVKMAEALGLQITFQPNQPHEEAAASYSSR